MLLWGSNYKGKWNIGNWAGTTIAVLITQVLVWTVCGWWVFLYLHNIILLPCGYFTDKKVQDKGDLSEEMASALPLWELLCPQSAQTSESSSCWPWSEPSAPAESHTSQQRIKEWRTTEDIPHSQMKGGLLDPIFHFWLPFEVGPLWMSPSLRVVKVRQWWQNV